MGASELGRDELGRDKSGPYREVAERPALYDVNARERGSSWRGCRHREEPVEMRQEQIDSSFRQRVADSLETTLKLGGGVVLVSIARWRRNPVF